MNLNPKARFLKSEHAEPFAAMVVSQSMQPALETAYLQWVEAKSHFTDDDHGTHAIGYQAQGIREFINIFLNLVENETPPPKTIRQNLKSS